ncbi:vWA domain-containing protein [Carboxydothermus ferrireducens]|uniref:Ca-activated chloride channel family protein n=1 Tax=Carboxydothermus ferrireducens DSM 11255 TaxID=1119529 RepID=A0ABX2RCI2_9THEO|nr:VWA domain-containing protein [Carboxydothermus ferrireducens]NYE57518.1 Ca-activated chloride channel family protein [Carboxydothermus ferrireducens DSM 11255]
MGLILNFFPEYEYFPVNHSTTFHLLLELNAPQAKDFKRSTPLNLAFVLDSSGSMAGSKIEYVKEAVIFALKQLTPSDSTSLTTFNSHVYTIFPSTRVVNSRELIQEVFKIYATGMTNLSGGILQGYNELDCFFSDQAINRVILLTDGLANVGITDPQDLIAIVANNTLKNKTLTCLGVGIDFDEDLLMSLVDAGKGNYYYINTPDRIPAFFEQELNGLAKISAQNIKLTLNFPELIVPVRIYDIKAKFHSKTSLTIDLDELYAGQSQRLLLLIQVENVSVPQELPVNIELQYFDANTLETVTKTFTFPLKFSGNQSLWEKNNREVVEEIAYREILEAREKTIFYADRGDVESLKRLQQELQAKEKHFVSLNAEIKEEYVKFMNMEIPSFILNRDNPGLRKQSTYDIYNKKRRKR